MDIRRDLIEYIEADKLEKSATITKKGLRDKLGKFLRRCQRKGIEVPRFTFSENERYSFNEDLLYDWVATKVDAETLEELTKKTINLDKLHDLSLSGKIDMSSLSEDVYSITKYFTISVSHPKLKKIVDLKQV